MTTVSALYEGTVAAHNVVRDLLDNGFGRDEISVVGAGVGAVTGGLIGALIDLGIDETAAEYYAEGVRRGGVLVMVQAGLDQVEVARALLERHHPVNLEDRARRWRDQGWQSFDPKAAPLAVDELEQIRARTGASLPETDHIDR